MRKLWGLAALIVGLLAEGGEVRAEWSLQYRSGAPSPYDRIYQYARPPGHRHRHHHHHHHHTQYPQPAPIGCWFELMRVPGGYAEVRRCGPVQRFAPVAPPGYYFTLD